MTALTVAAGRDRWPIRQVLSWMLFGLLGAVAGESDPCRCRRRLRDRDRWPVPRRRGRSVAGADDRGRRESIDHGHVDACRSASSSITVEVWPLSATQTFAPTVPMTEFEDTLPLTDFTRFGSGIYEVTATTETCEISGWVDVQGPALYETVAGIVGLECGGRRCAHRRPLAARRAEGRWHPIGDRRRREWSASGCSSSRSRRAPGGDAAVCGDLDRHPERPGRDRSRRHGRARPCRCRCRCPRGRRGRRGGRGRLDGYGQLDGRGRRRGRGRRHHGGRGRCGSRRRRRDGRGRCRSRRRRGRGRRDGRGGCRRGRRGRGCDHLDRRSRRPSLGVRPPVVPGRRRRPDAVRASSSGSASNPTRASSATSCIVPETVRGRYTMTIQLIADGMRLADAGRDLAGRSARHGRRPVPGCRPSTSSRTPRTTPSARPRSGRCIRSTAIRSGLPIRSVAIVRTGGAHRRSPRLRLRRPAWTSPCRRARSRRT